MKENKGCELLEEEASRKIPEEKTEEEKKSSVDSLIEKGKKGKLVIQTPAAVPMESACNATFRLEAIDKRFMKSKNRRVRITEITSQNPAVVVNNYTYEKSPANGKMIDPLQPELPGGETKPIRKDGKIVFVEIQSATSTLICKVQHK